MKKPACTAVALVTAAVIAPATPPTVAPARVAARWRQPRSAALRAGLAVLTLLLAACGGSDSAPNASATVATVATVAASATSAASADPPTAPGAARGFSQVSTVAGSGQDGHIDSAGRRAAASFHQPLGVVADSQGNVYVADTLNHQIRKIMTNGQVLTWAGSGRPGAADGIGSSASFNAPHGLALAADDSLVVADTGNHRVRQISRSGHVSTLAGSGLAGDADGAAAAAQFNGPEGVAVLGDAIWVADARNHKIRCIGADGRVSTLAGSGAPGAADGVGPAASFNSPSGIAADGAGAVYVGDTANHKIRRIDGSGTVSTLAGTGQAGALDGSPANALFSHPAGVAVARDGAVYVADTGNHSIRKITAAGIVSMFAGPDQQHRPGPPGGVGPVARFNQPSALAATFDGVLVVADAANHAIHQITPAGAVGLLAGTGSAGAADGFAVAPVALHQPLGLAVDDRGTAYLTQAGWGALRKIAADGLTTTLAQGGNDSNLDGVGPAAAAWQPVGLAVNAQGTAFVADAANHLVRKVSAWGVVSTLAGQPRAGAADGLGTAASFNAPQGLVLDAQGTVFLSDTGNHKIRKISAAGVVTTWAGSGQAGTADGAAATASFNRPGPIARDALGNLYVYDTGSFILRKISPAGVVSTVAGSGQSGFADGRRSAASFNLIGGIAVDKAGVLFHSDTVNHMLRRVAADGNVSTLAGQPGQFGAVNGGLSSARFFAPSGIALRADGSLLVADMFNHPLRKID